MRLAVFTNQFPGQVNTYFSRDMRALLENDIEMEIYPVRPCDATLWSRVPNILNKEIFPRSKVHNINPMQAFPFVLKRSFVQIRELTRDLGAICISASKFGIWQLMKSLYAIFKAWGLTHQNETDIDHVLAYWGNYSATYAYVFHRLIDRDIPFSMFLHAGIDLYRDQVFLKEKLLYADNIFVVCEFNRQYIKELYPEIYSSIETKIHLYHLGLNLDDYIYKRNGRIPGRIIAVGRLDKKKGFDYLMRALHALLLRGQEVELELVGDGEEKKSLMKLAGQLGIQDQVLFRGWLSFDEVKSSMAQAAILVHPSPGLGDAVPTVIKEAMAMGTPVIASSVAGIPELLDYGRCGILFPPRDTKALSDALFSLLNDNDMRYQYAQKGRIYAEEKFDLWHNGYILTKQLRAKLSN